MQKVSNGLAETVLDKTTALKHQRASNRLLGDRVTELEAKLRALEMSGFWNVPEGFAEEEESQRQVCLFVCMFVCLYFRLSVCGFVYMIMIIRQLFCSQKNEKILTL